MSPKQHVSIGIISDRPGAGSIKRSLPTKVLEQGGTMEGTKRTIGSQWIWTWRNHIDLVAIGVSDFQIR